MDDRALASNKIGIATDFVDATRKAAVDERNPADGGVSPARWAGEPRKCLQARCAESGILRPLSLILQASRQRKVTTMDVVSGVDGGKLASAAVLWVFLAILIEEACNILFNWKYYKERLGGKGLKTPIVVFVSLLICFVFDTDIFMLGVQGVGLTAESNWLSKILSALLLGGGSSTAFRVFQRFREARKQLQQPQP